MVKELKATLLVETLIPSGQQRYETASRWVCLPLLSSHSNQSPTLLPSWLLNENNFLSLLMDSSGLRPRLLQPHFPSRPTWTLSSSYGDGLRHLLLFHDKAHTALLALECFVTNWHIFARQSRTHLNAIRLQRCFSQVLQVAEFIAPTLVLTHQSTTLCNNLFLYLPASTPLGYKPFQERDHTVFICYIPKA